MIRDKAIFLIIAFFWLLGIASLIIIGCTSDEGTKFLVLAGALLIMVFRAAYKVLKHKEES